MSDHTEREREARWQLESEVADEMHGGVPGRDTQIPDLLDAYRAAVRSAVLAEVRAKVDGLQTYLPWEEVLVGRKDVFAALTALEATDAGRL